MKIQNISSPTWPVTARILGRIAIITLLGCSPVTAAATSISNPLPEIGLSDVTDVLVGISIFTVLFFGVGAAIMFALIEQLNTHEKSLASMARIAARAAGNANGSGIIVTNRDGNKPQRQFQVVIAKELLSVIHHYVTKFLRVHGQDQEAGGMLVGEYLWDEAAGIATFKIQGFIDAGPAAEFSAGSILFDVHHQSRALRELQLDHPQAGNLGCIHRHPGSLDVCSGGDAVTDREAVRQSDTKALVFAIITLNNSRQGPSSLFHEDFKIDFYLMAEETGFNYVPIKPVLADLPVLETSPALNALLKLHGSDAAYDLAVLRQLPDMGKSMLHLVKEAIGSSVWMHIGFKNAPETLHVRIQPNGSTQLMVKDEHGGKSVLSGPWEQPETGRHMWLSHLVLVARERLAESRHTTGYGSHFSGLLQDKQRLVAEVRAMQERYGDRAILRRRGDDLYWEYTVRESGRSFPIEIHYPDTYPNNPPEIISVVSLPPTHHSLPGNKLCWIDVYSGQCQWNPSRDTAVICVNAAQRWFACLLVYLTTGCWPKGAEY